MTARALALSLLMPALAAAQKGDPAVASGAVRDILQGKGVQAALSRLQYQGLGGAACDHLVQYAGTQNVRLRRDVAQALGQFAEKRHAQALEQLAVDPDVSLRLSAARGYGHAKLESPALWLLLSDKASGVRREAARALGGLKRPDVGQKLLAAADTEGEPEVREAMLLAAASVPFPGLASRLERHLSHTSETTRMAAAHALCVLGAASGLAVAREKLQSQSRYDRKDGVLLLEGAPLKVALPLLKPLLDARPPEVAVAAPAARVLAQAGDKASLEWLVLQADNAPNGGLGPLLDAIEALKVTDADRQDILRRHAIVP